MSPSLFWVISLSLYLIVFFAILLVSRLTFIPFDSKSFSFRRVFPFEVKINSGKYGRIYELLIYLFVFVSFLPIVLIVNNKNSEFFQTFILILFTLGSLLFSFLNVFEVVHVKVHLIIFVLFASAVLLSNVLTLVNGITTYNLNKDHNVILPSYLVSGIISGILALFSLILIFNPKLRTWAKLDKVEGKENEYIRPSKFPLAYSEWYLFFILFIGEISFFIQLA